MKTAETKSVRSTQSGRPGSGNYQLSYNGYETDVLDTDEDLVMRYYIHVPSNRQTPQISVGPNKVSDNKRVWRAR